MEMEVGNLHILGTWKGNILGFSHFLLVDFLVYPILILLSQLCEWLTGKAKCNIK